MTDNRKPELILVAPVFNEQESLAVVIEEWLPVLQQLRIDFKILIVDDGSTDNTPSEIERLKSRHSEVTSHRHTNRGHGPSLLDGYRLAIEQHAQWVLQIDSDGQCAPMYFKKMWANREQSDFHFGTRVQFEEGIKRAVVSWGATVVVSALAGCYIRDANVPYRLMQAQKLGLYLGKIPHDFYLANIGLTFLIVQENKITWYPIVFRKRFGGQRKINFAQTIKLGRKLPAQLRRL